MALINVSAIPSEWANLAGWTRSYALQGREAKRPLIPANKAESAPDLVSLLSGDTDANPIGACGFLTSDLNDVCIIDIDAPADVKSAVKALSDIDSKQMVVERELLSKLPQGIMSLIKTTYSEYSSSGAGIHIVFKTDKSSLPQKAYKHPVDFDGQLSIRNNYMVTTGNKLADSPSVLAVVPYTVLDVLFGLTSKQKSEDDEDDGIRGADALADSEVVPSVTEMDSALMLIPLDKSPRIQEVYKQVFEEQYEHYQLWLRVGMALHNYAVKTNKLPEMLQLYIKWSITDATDFESDEDVANKWNSFSATEDSITFRTIFKLAISFQFQYPRRLRKRDGTLLISPDKTEYVNFKYLIDKYNIKLYSSGVSNIDLYLTGDKDIIEQYFLLNGVTEMFGYYGPFDASLLQAATWRLCQDSYWRQLTSTQNFVQTWLTEPRKIIDMFEVWLDAPNDKLSNQYKYPRYFDGRSTAHRTSSPEKNTFKYLLSCITWASHRSHDHLLFNKMLYKTLMQLIKLHDSKGNTFEDNGGMFALIGPENTYKTTFFKLLLPRPLEFMRKDVNQELDSEKNKRDFTRYLGTRAIVLVDEFEGFMNQKKSGSFFKSVISSNNMDFTEIYNTTDKSLQRKAILVGTSNDTKQIISDNGSRRLWLAEIDGIDTNKMLDIDLHALYNNIRNEYRSRVSDGNAPWLMKMEDTQRITEQNKEIKVKSSLDIALEELFPYDEPVDLKDEATCLRLGLDVPTSEFRSNCGNSFSNYPHLYTTLSVLRLLDAHGIRANSAELSRALERFCSDYTKTYTRAIDVSTFKATGKRVDRQVYKGKLWQYKTRTGGYRYSAWILPTNDDIMESDDE